MSALLTRAAVGGAVAAAGCVAYGTTVERWWFRRRHLVLDGALPSGPPLRIAHLADTHLTPPDPRLVRFVRDEARRSTADLVVATGDLLGAVGAEDATVEMLAPLTAGGTPGLVVLGSNDLYGPRPKSPLLYFTDPDARRHGVRLDTDRFVAGLEATGWTVLRDDHVTIEAGGRTIAVSGLEDPHLDETVLPPATSITPPGAADADLHLGLVHAPYVAALDLLRDVGAEVLLAGHTHGGQVRLPGAGALVGNCDLPLDRIRGASRWRDAWLHITPGLGQSCYAPFRFCCRPELSVLDLTT